MVNLVAVNGNVRGFLIRFLIALSTVRLFTAYDVAYDVPEYTLDEPPIFLLATSIAASKYFIFAATDLFVNAELYPTETFHFAKIAS